jgi:hypothetical protein
MAKHNFIQAYGYHVGDFARLWDENASKHS